MPDDLPDFGPTTNTATADLPDWGPAPKKRRVPGPIRPDNSLMAGLQGAAFAGPFTATEDVGPGVGMVPPALRLTGTPTQAPTIEGAPETGKLQPNLQLYPGPSTLEKVGQGLGESLIKTADFLLSPASISTAGMGALPKLAQRGVAAYFAYKMATELPDTYSEVVKELNKPADKRDVQKLSRLIGDAVTQTGFTAAGAYGALHRGTPDILASNVREGQIQPDVLQAGRFRFGATPLPLPGAAPAFVPTPLTVKEEENRLVPQPGQALSAPWNLTWPINRQMPVQPGALPPPPMEVGPMGQRAPGPWTKPLQYPARPVPRPAPSTAQPTIRDQLNALLPSWTPEELDQLQQGNPKLEHRRIRGENEAIQNAVTLLKGQRTDELPSLMHPDNTADVGKGEDPLIRIRGKLDLAAVEWLRRNNRIKIKTPKEPAPAAVAPAEEKPAPSPTIEDTDEVLSMVNSLPEGLQDYYRAISEAFRNENPNEAEGILRTIKNQTAYHAQGAKERGEEKLVETLNKLNDHYQAQVDNALKAAEQTEVVTPTEERAPREIQQTLDFTGPAKPVTDAEIEADIAHYERALSAEAPDALAALNKREGMTRQEYRDALRSAAAKLPIGTERALSVKSGAELDAQIKDLEKKLRRHDPDAVRKLKKEASGAKEGTEEQRLKDYAHALWKELNLRRRNLNERIGPGLQVKPSAATKKRRGQAGAIFPEGGEGKEKGKEDESTGIGREQQHIGTPQGAEIQGQPKEVRQGEGEQDSGGGGVQRLPPSETQVQAQTQDVGAQPPPTGAGEVSQTEPVPPAATTEGSAQTGGAETPPVSPAISETTPPKAQTQASSHEEVLAALRASAVEAMSRQLIPAIERFTRAAGSDWRTALKNYAKRNDQLFFIIPEKMTRDAAVNKLARQMASRELRLQGGATIAREGGKTPPPPDLPEFAEVDLPQGELVHGINYWVREIRAKAGYSEPIEWGIGIADFEAVKRGQDMLRDDPAAADKAAQQFARTKAVNADMLTVVRAAGESAQREAINIERRQGTNNDAWRAARAEIDKWDALADRMRNEWHRLGQTQHGFVLVDTGSFTGIQRAVRRATEGPDKPGKELTGKDKQRAEDIADKVHEAGAKSEAAQDAWKKALDDEAERLKAEERKIKEEADRLEATEPGSKRAKRARRKADAIYAGLTPLNVSKLARGLLELGDLTFDEVVGKLSDKFGVSKREIIELLAKPKYIRNITTEMWKRASEQRRLTNTAKAFIKEMTYGRAANMFRSVPRLAFELKTLGHGSVGMITHAGINMVDPYQARIYWLNSMRQWGFMFNHGYHDRMMAKLLHDDYYDLARRAGLANDPFHYYDDFQSQQVTLARLPGFRTLIKSGQYGFDALKTFRQDRFNQIWNKLPDEVVHGDEQQQLQVARVVADAVNKATGISMVNMGDFTPWANVLFFAPRLEASRWAWLIKDPIKALAMAPKVVAGKATLAEETFVKSQLKEKATIASAYIGLLMANQAILNSMGSNQRINFPLTDPDWNPRRADFMAFKAAGKQIGIISPMLHIVQMFAQLTNMLMGPRTKFQRLTPREGATGEIGERYWRGKLSPASQTLADLAFRTDVRGRPLPWSDEPVPRYQRIRGVEPYTLGEYIGEQVSPIPVEELLREKWDAEHVSRSNQDKWFDALTAFGAAMTGARMRTDVMAQ